MASALVAGAWWLREPDIRYLVVSAVATIGAAGAAYRSGGGRRAWALAAVGAGAIFLLIALLSQRDISRIERDWEGHRATALERGVRLMSEAIEREHVALRRMATAALDAPDTRIQPAAAFRHLAGLPTGEQRAVVLFQAGAPGAWSGTVHLPVELAHGSAGVAVLPFHTVLYAAEERAGRRAVASAVLRAEPPADRLVPGLQDGVAGRTGLRGFRFPDERASAADAGAALLALTGDFSIGVVPTAPSREEALLRAIEAARSLGVVALAIALLTLLVASWRVRATLPWRLIPLAAGLAMLALLPLSAFSRVTVLFDPTVYFAEFGGAFTANLGALLLAGAIMLLTVLLVLRAGVPGRARAPAIVLVTLIIALGPYLLRLLSRGVTPPPGGITTGLWLAWEIALFLAAATLLLVVAATSPLIRRSSGGLHPAVAPALAALAALVGPIAMESTGGWPVWYALLWIVAIGALAITRRHAWVVISVAIVAGLGAATVTWNAGVRGRMALAERDVASLTALEPFLDAVLERLADDLDDEPAPRTDADLLRAYVRSDLEGTGFPVHLASWSPEELLQAELPLAPLSLPEEELLHLIASAKAAGERVILPLRNTTGAHLALSVPYADGTVFTLVVGPRTRLIADAPFNVLIGLEPRERGAPPYTLTLADDVQPEFVPGEGIDWYRTDGELHGVGTVVTHRGPARAHIEIELRSLDVLVQSGTLVVLLNLVVILTLWVISTLPGGGLGRWLRRRLRGWRQSYRARLTIALFAFFVIPAAAFALWSYQRLQSEDRRSRELLVREGLRAFAAGEQLPPLEVAGTSRDAPLWLYHGGEVRQTSVPLLGMLAPTGRFLPPSAHLQVVAARELFASHVLHVAERPMLFGYRAATDPEGVPVVLAMPARGNEEVLERRRRDLGILVLFATVLGAFGALWLSGVAARSLAEPIGSLRSAALAIASGEREPPLEGVAPLEFRPVFSAFRRMASDLGESRAALEAAQRRTAAVLRNVASGVVAIRDDGLVALANPRAEALLGCALPPGAPLPPLGEIDMPARMRSFLSGTDDEEEHDLAAGDRQLHARFTRLPGTGGAVVTLDDVTEIARAQRVLAWGEMARQVAHEIKNPLTPIRLGVQHLKRAHGDPRADFGHILDQNVGRILAEIDRLDEIARSFSRYGALPAERQRPEPTDVSAVARDVVELERMGTGDLDWELQGAEHPIHARARADELREVLLNLLENARHAGARRVSVSLEATDGRIVIEVHDDGRGIPPQILPRIFEPHFSTRTSGSGLGLAVSRQMVESWGGSIEISSTIGTLVRVELEATR